MAKQHESPQPEILRNIEAVVATTLKLVPQVLRVYADYLFRPGQFLQRGLAKGRDIYGAPPYTFLAISGFLTTIAVGFAVAAAQWAAETLSFFPVPSESDGALVLAQRIQDIEERSLTTAFVTTAIIVLGVSAVARAIGHLALPKNRNKLERLVCYVAGAHQLQIILLTVASVGLVTASVDVGLALWPVVAVIVIFLVYGALWPIVTVSRAVGIVRTLRAPWRFALGILFAVTNIGIVVVAVYATEAVPRTLGSWRDGLQPTRSSLDYRIVSAASTLTDAREMILTIVIQIRSGRPLIIDLERRQPNVYPDGMDSYVNGARVLDSSDGQAPILVVRSGETKWLRVAFQLSDGAVAILSTDFYWSGTLDFGEDEIHVRDVFVYGAPELTKALSR